MDPLTAALIDAYHGPKKSNEVGLDWSTIVAFGLKILTDMLAQCGQQQTLEAWQQGNMRTRARLRLAVMREGVPFTDQANMVRAFLKTGEVATDETMGAFLAAHQA